MNRSREELIDNNIIPIRLRKILNIPSNLYTGLVKCRIVFDEEIQEIQFTPYQYKSVQSLKLIEDNTIEYHIKYLDRDHINELFNQRGSCDDIVIIKDGKLTDSSYSNIALLKDSKWYTPRSCLLSGMRRQQLIDQGRLLVADISVEDLYSYEKITLINAMMGLKNSFSVSNICI